MVGVDQRRSARPSGGPGIRLRPPCTPSQGVAPRPRITRLSSSAFSNFARGSSCENRRSCIRSRRNGPRPGDDLQGRRRDRAAHSGRSNIELSSRAHRIRIFRRSSQADCGGVLYYGCRRLVHHDQPGAPGDPLCAANRVQQARRISRRQTKTSSSAGSCRSMQMQSVHRVSLRRMQSTTPRWRKRNSWRWI